MNLVNIFLPTLEPLFGLLVYSKSDFFFSYQMLIFCHVPLRRLAKVQAWMCYRYCCFSYLWCFAVCLSIFFLNIASPISCCFYLICLFFLFILCHFINLYINFWDSFRAQKSMKSKACVTAFCTIFIFEVLEHL